MSGFPRVRRLCIGYALLFAVLVSRTAPAGNSYPDPFEHAQRVPSNAHTYISFVDGAATLSELLKTPIGPGLSVFYASSESGEAWKRLGVALNLDTHTLLTEIFNDRVTLVSASRDDADANPIPTESRQARSDELADNVTQQQVLLDRWVIMARTKESTVRTLIHSKQARIRAYVGEIAVYISDDATLLFAHRDGHLYLGSPKSEPLLQSMLAPIIAPSLADDPEFRRARRVGPGQAAFFKRGTRENTWDAGAARISSRHVRLRFINSTAQPLPAHDDSVNIELLDRLSADALYVSVEHTPTSQGVAQQSDRPSAGLGVWPFASLATARPDLLDELGSTMFTVVAPAGSETGDPDGYPAVAIGVELGPSIRVVESLDQFMSAATSQLCMAGQIRKPASSPVIQGLWEEPRAVRTADLAGRGVNLEMIGMPNAEWPARLVWSTSFAGKRAWWIASTDRGLHDRLHSALGEMSEEPRRLSTCNLSRGAAFGSQISEMFMHWPAVANAAADRSFASRLRSWSELLRHVDALRWRTVRLNDHEALTYALVSWTAED